jgi:hypothetical protein
VCKSLVVDNLCRVDSNDEDGTIRSLTMILPQYLSFASAPGPSLLSSWLLKLHPRQSLFCTVCIVPFLEGLESTGFLITKIQADSLAHHCSPLVVNPNTSQSIKCFAFKIPFPHSMVGSDQSLSSHSPNLSIQFS